MYILKILVNTLVLSQLHALPVCGPTLETDAASQLQSFCNCAVQITCGLQKYDHILAACCNLGWLPLDLLMQHCTLCI